MTKFEIGDWVSIKFVEELDVKVGLGVGSVVKVTGMFDTPCGTQIALVTSDELYDEHFIHQYQAELFLKQSEVEHID